MRPGMRVAQLLNIAFDMGAWEILGSLYNGSTLCLRGNTSKEWAALMKTVDIVIATPSILTCHDPSDYPSIKHVIVGGEPCPQSRFLLVPDRPKLIRTPSTNYSPRRQVGAIHKFQQLLRADRNIDM